MGEIEIFSTRIKELRESLQMTQTQFSGFIGIKQQTLSGYERGIMKPPLDVVKLIAQKCHVSVDWLCGLSDKQRTDDKPTTYSDILKILLDIDKILHFKIVDPDLSRKDIWSSAKCIVFDSDTMSKYLKELGKFKDLLRQKSIDNDIYQACIEKLLRDSNINFKNELF